MRIADILSHKGRAVHSVLPELTVAEAVDRLRLDNVGALLVCDADQCIRGIVSERDIVRSLGAHGAALLTLTVADIMTRKVATCRPDDSVADGMARMTRGRFRHLPVVEADKLVGLVSIGDLVKHRLHEMELETGVLRDMVIARS